IIEIKREEVNIVIKHPIIGILLTIILASGCGVLRSEFYRGETHYLYNQGNQAYKAGEFNRARECFQQVIKADPGYARGFAGLGNLALIKGDFDEAIRCYSQAMTLEPGLEETLLPLMLVAKEQQARQPVVNCGMDLRKVLTLLSNGRENELENLLSRDVPLELVAKDTLSITLEELVKLRSLVVERVDAGGSSPRCRLFFGYFLFYADQRDWLAAKVLENAAKDVSGRDQQHAYEITGKLYERMGQEKKAANAFLKAVKAGMPLAEVAPFLAKIYGVPVEKITIVSSPSKKNEKAAPSVEATSLSSGTVGQ
ncbi:MAG: tetratricopeptide repeat protein, partial [Deltaproteobacteria bacterium]|nr:tetratricopeptide repeat protein [Deltaproteobacteria bacterium]